jgi:hypothetical protein
MGKFFAGAGSALIGGALSGISNLFGALINLDFAPKSLFALPIIEESLEDRFYVAGFTDRSFCSRKVALSISYDDFCHRACGPGETSGID